VDTQIKQVKVVNLHGIFTKKVNFNQDYTFIHGINGTGKTSLIKAMEAILTPDMEWIVNTAYESVQISLVHEKQKYTFKLQREGSLITIRQRRGNEYIEEIHDISRVEMLVKNRERHVQPVSGGSDTIRSLIFQIFSGSGILKTIQSIPTPMFLGLNRTAFLDRDYDLDVFERRRAASVPSELSGDALEKSMLMALRLIHRAARLLIQRRKIHEDRLRTDITFLLFSNPASNQSHSGLSIPSLKDISKYRRMRIEISDTLIKLGFARDNIHKFVDPFFDTLISNTRVLSKYNSLQHVFDSALKDVELNDVFSRWIESTPILRLIDRYFEIIDAFNKKIQSLRSEITQFESIVNGFFQDSNKVMNVTDTGEVNVSQGSKTFNVDKLSSGEKQIFILISQLTFNPLLKKANVLIIDEPEISLHVRWQEVFVDGIRDANPNTQLILATHSPSIVLDRKDKMVDLNAA
jgi:predicted ATP-binding protein involved in virulence